MTKKHIVIGVIGGGIFLFILFNFGVAAKVAGAICTALYPIFTGTLFASVLNVPVKFLENKVFKRLKSNRLKRLFSVLAVVTAFAGLAVGIVFLVAPEVKKSLESLTETWNTLKESGLNGLFGGGTFWNKITDAVGNIPDRLIDGVISALPAAGDVLQKSAKTVFALLFGLVFGLLIIINKEEIIKGVYRAARLFMDEQKTKKAFAVLKTATDKFSAFLAGSLIEGLIFGTICYIAFLAFRIPYAAFLAPIMALFNFIPTLGAYVGGGLGVLLLLTVSPEAALTFLIVYFVIQQVEQFTTYPLIVGRYVGINGFWVLFAVVTGGSLFGVWGMVLGVPLIAFADNLVKAVAANKNPSALALTNALK